MVRLVYGNVSVEVDINWPITDVIEAIELASGGRNAIYMILMEMALDKILENEHAGLSTVCSKTN
jgi:hypothetical protein